MRDIIKELREFNGDGYTRFAGKTMCEFAADEIARLTAERDTARAETAMGYRNCLTLLRDVGLAGDHDTDPLSQMFMDQCPADAKAALEARDKAVREAALREAATICNQSYGDGLGQAHMAVLALIEKEETK